MKKKLGGLILFLIVLVLLAGIVLLAYVIARDLFNPNTVQTVHTDDKMIAVDKGTGTSAKTEKKSIIESISDIFTSSDDSDEVTYSNNESTGKYFYEQLNDTSKIIYNGLQENKKNLMTGTYSIEFGNKFYDVLSKENGDKKLGDDYQSAIEAFTHDNVDLFFIDVSKMYLNIETKKKVFNTTYNVYIKPMNEKNYFAEGFSSKEQVQEALNQVEQYKDYIKYKANGNTYNKIKYIHDYLIKTADYDENSKGTNRYTIYGALIDKKCVCEGYARAFKYLADAAGIENILMQGTATNSEGSTENHAWNAVKINNNWYLIDVTWDDPIIIGHGFIESSVHYRYFLKGTNSFYKDHKIETQFTKNGKVFTVPKISEDNY